MKPGKTLQELAVELDRQNRTKKDYLVDTPALAMSYDADPGRLTLNLNFGVGSDDMTTIRRMEVSDIAHRQIGAHLGIPARYYDKMRSDYPELLSANVNGWFNRNPDKRMIRTLDGRARAYLSDRYRRIDNYEIAQTVLPIIGEIADVSVGSFELTDAKMYIKAVNPRLTAEVVPGDIVQAGIMVTNSETGQGAVSVQPIIYRLICSNGMVAADYGQRRYHIGRGNENLFNAGQGNKKRYGNRYDNAGHGGDDCGDYEIFRDATIEADDKAFMMKIEDTVRAVVDQVRFDKLVGRLREAAGAKMETTNIPKIVELSARVHGLTQDEGDGVLQHLIRGGDLSLYGLANAVTRQSQDAESYDRATELEAIGWNVATMSPALWRRINALENVTNQKYSS